MDLDEPHVTSDPHAAEIIDDLVAECRKLREQNELMAQTAVPMTEEIARLSKALAEAPEYERAMRLAVENEPKRLLAALKEALDGWIRWLDVAGIITSDRMEIADRIAELRKEFGL